MNFYTEWLKEYNQNNNCNNYIVQFLNKSPNSVVPLHSGTVEELSAAYEVLNVTRLQTYLEVLLTLRLNRSLKTEEIPQYSSFEDGVSRITELLEFYPEGESFVKLGYQMVNAPNETANRKYGENHSRLAESMDLVVVSLEKPRYSKNTAWGHYLVQYTIEQKESVLKKMLLREYFIQLIIQKAFQGTVSYFELTSFLALSTAIRRRSNTKYIIEYILKGTDWECYLENIDWKEPEVEE